MDVQDTQDVEINPVHPGDPCKICASEYGF